MSSSNIPGIWNERQVAAWKRVVDRVHEKGGFIYLQLWALGRGANTEVLAREGRAFVSASDIPLTVGGAIPTPLTREDIQRYVETYAQAAKNAVFGAGFDGVEVHMANGYRKSSLSRFPGPGLTTLSQCLTSSFNRTPTKGQMNLGGQSRTVLASLFRYDHTLLHSET